MDGMEKQAKKMIPISPPRSQQERQQQQRAQISRKIQCSDLIIINLNSTVLKSALCVFLLISIIISFFLVSAFNASTPFPSHWQWRRRRGWSISIDINSSSSEDPTATLISHIVFGLGGSAATWPIRHRYSELWWDPNSTRGYVWLDEDLQSELPSNFSPPIRVSPHFSGSTSDRIARIVKESFELNSNSTNVIRWFVMGDDDTFFFPENLASVLSRYDHRRMVYVGAPSESVEQVALHSYRTAFGGGGFAISYPLARELAGSIDRCLERYNSFYGSDEKVSACVGELGVPLTRESGFHQLDIRDDPYGLLAAHPLTPLVSLHHLDYFKPLFPNKTQLDSLRTLMDAYRLDPPRMLQHTICSYHQYPRTNLNSWSMSISWGYTVQLYTSLLTSRELEIPLQTFKTWRTSSDGPFTFDTRPMQPNPCDQPIVFFMDRAEEEEEDTQARRPDGIRRVLTTKYLRAAADDESQKRSCNRSEYKEAMGVHSIVVVASKMNPKDWIMAPRRECCQIRRHSPSSSAKKHISLTVKLRSCRPGQTITA